MRTTPIEDGFIGYNKKSNPVKKVSKISEVSKTKSNMKNKKQKNKQEYIPPKKISIKQPNPDEIIPEIGKGTNFDRYV